MPMSMSMYACTWSIYATFATLCGRAGMQLATLVRRNGLVAVHSGLAMFAESFGAYRGYEAPRATTLVWHEASKVDLAWGP
jgi:hypothetical protein